MSYLLAIDTFCKKLRYAKKRERKINEIN